MIKHQTNNIFLIVQDDCVPLIDVKKIADEQQCIISKIIEFYNYKTDIMVDYKIVISPGICGAEYNRLLKENSCSEIKDFKTNAFAWFPNEIYATYNETIKAIGYHELAHIIAYDYFKCRSSRFIEEGLSVSFDNEWLGLSLDKCAKYLLITERIISIDDLYENVKFNTINDSISYPICGSFIKWIIKKYGKKIIEEISLLSKIIS